MYFSVISFSPAIPWRFSFLNALYKLPIMSYDFFQPNEQKNLPSIVILKFKVINKVTNTRCNCCLSFKDGGKKQVIASRKSII